MGRPRSACIVGPALCALLGCGARSPLAVRGESPPVDAGSAIAAPDSSTGSPVPPAPDAGPALSGTLAGLLLRVDATGPVARIAGASQPSCALSMGLPLGAFVPTCAPSTASLKNLTSGRTHGDDTWAVGAFGMGLGFNASTLAADSVLTDGTAPAASDGIVALSVDGSMPGAILNDYADGAGTQLDLHGSGAVYKEYARLVTRDLLALSGIAPGPTSACLLASTSQANGYANPGAWVESLPSYCTGFEGMVTAAPAAAGDVTDLGLLALQVDPKLKNGLRPGSPVVDFCADANGDGSHIGTPAATGYNLCGAGADIGYGAHGALFATSLAQAVRVFGHGAESNLPADAWGASFYFKEYVRALLEYMTVGTSNPVTDLSQVSLDYDNFAFGFDGDMSAGGPDAGATDAGMTTGDGLAFGVYVDRRFVSGTQAPLSVRVTGNPKAGIVTGYAFTRYLTRGETAIATAMRQSPPHPLGSEDSVLLTNVLGSPVLASWPTGTTSSAYECATMIPTPADCPAGSLPTDAMGNMLLDDNGKPILTAYQGAMSGSATSFSLGNVGITVSDTGCAPASQGPPSCESHIFATVPVHQNPYDPASPALAPITELLPWAPKAPGTGYAVPVNGEQINFVTANGLDASGLSLPTQLYYDCQVDSMTGECAAGGALKLEAVSSATFLGKVFLCQDGADLLSAQMFTPVARLLEWIADRPAGDDAFERCGILIRYSPFDNYVSAITSLPGGVTLQVNGGRVAGVLLFLP